MPVSFPSIFWLLPPSPSLQIFLLLVRTDFSCFPAAYRCFLLFRRVSFLASSSSSSLISLSSFLPLYFSLWNFIYFFYSVSFRFLFLSVYLYICFLNFLPLFVTFWSIHNSSAGCLNYISSVLFAFSPPASFCSIRLLILLFPTPFQFYFILLRVDLVYIDLTVFSSPFSYLFCFLQIFFAVFLSFCFGVLESFCS